MLPLYKGEFVGMMKLTSIVGYISIQDLTKAGDIIRSRTYEAFFPLLATAAIYFVVSSLITALIGRMEVKLDSKRRPRKLPKGVTEKTQPHVEHSDCKNAPAPGEVPSPGFFTVLPALVRVYGLRTDLIRRLTDRRELAEIPDN